MKSPFNTTITGLYTTKKGNLRSLQVDSRTFDALSKIKLGDVLLVKMVSEEMKEAKGDRFPHAFLEILEVKEESSSL